MMTSQSSEVAAPVAVYRTSKGLYVSHYAVALDQIPVDFYADPDGQWTYEELACAAGFGLEQGVAVGALRESFDGHPDGSAVVTLNAESRPYVAIIECPVAYRLDEQAAEAISAA